MTLKLTPSSLKLCQLLFLIATINSGFAQITDRELPKEWDSLIYGGQFSDRFLPIPIIGDITDRTWGVSGVIPRDISNGIEHPDWSYWGGRYFQSEDGKYNGFICRWSENDPKGHFAYHESEIVWVQSDNPIGPYKPVGEPIGLGHNPNVFRLNDGRWVVYTIGKGYDVFYYISKTLNGPWSTDRFQFDLRDREQLFPMVNVSFSKREDGAFLAVPRAGDIWISQTGISTYHRLTNDRVYPPIEGKFEDPVIWKDHIQYHVIVNDWLGRIAYHLRSKDGVKWKTDPGKAYFPGISIYEDGTQTNWYKYERIRVLQDEYGRAIQANFAVIDSTKHSDLQDDNHSSKNISIPLVKDRFLKLLNKEKIDESTKEIKVLLSAEEDFNPIKEVDVSSLRLGASEQVNFGNGCRLITSKKKGKDLLLVFDARGHGLNADNFAIKLLGKTKNGKLLTGYAKLPWVQYVEPILSSRKPYIEEQLLKIEVQNFGQISSKEETIIIEVQTQDREYQFEGAVKPLDSFETTLVSVEKPDGLESTTKGNILVYLKGDKTQILYQREHDLQYLERATFTGASKKK
ncbi:MAG: glycoside hydrolase family protein [Cyclobacteriaceae bacterium]